MKIGLLNPCSENPAKGTLIWPPLGLCRLARFLKGVGHEVIIIEDALNKYSDDEIREKTAGLDVVGIGAMTLQVFRVEHLIPIIKSQGHPIIVCGGPHYSAIPKLPKDCDALVIGDGEQAFLDIINGKRGVIQGKFSQDYIYVDFTPLDDYLKYGDHLIDGTRAITILTARGCPFNCKFCGSPLMFGRRVTYYPLEKVVRNMDELSSMYNIKAFRIFDDTFTLLDRRVEEFCKLVEPKGYRMSCLTNIHTIREKTLRTMKNAGFEFVAIGAESTDPNVLRLANKRQTQEDIEQAIEQIHNAGLKAEVLFIIGLPGETTESLAKTIAFASKLKVFRIHSQFFTPFPGCEFNGDVSKYGTIIEPDYKKWTHRIPVFKPYTISLKDLVALAEEFFRLAGRTLGS